MVTLFENYEQQYSVLTADITAQIGLLSTSATSKPILKSYTPFASNTLN